MPHEVYEIERPGVPFGEKDPTADRIQQVYDVVEATGGEIIAGHTVAKSGSRDTLYLVARLATDNAANDNKQ